MHEKIEAFARTEIKKGLAACTEAQQSLFRRMYSNKDPDKEIGLVVDAMPSDKLDNALDQVERTLIKNGQRESS